MPNPQEIRQRKFTPADAAAARYRFLVLGLLSVALGAAAIALPLATAYPVAVGLGLILMAIGAADVFHAFMLRANQGFLLSWLSATLFFFVGLLLAVSPALEPMSMPYLLGLMFLLGGGLRAGKGLNIAPVSGWQWVVASGVLGMAFGAWILWQWRTVTLTDVSILAGISMVMDGFSRVTLFAAGQRAARDRT